MLKLLGIGLLAAAFGAALAQRAAGDAQGLEPVRVGPFHAEVAAFYGTDDGLPGGEVVCLAVAGGAVFAGAGQGLARFESGAWHGLPEFEGRRVDALAADAGALLAVSGGTVYRIAEGQVAALATLPDAIAGPGRVRSIAPGTPVYLGADAGLFELSEGAVAPVDALNDQLGAAPAIREVAVAADGEVAVAASAGLYVRAAGGAWARLFPCQRGRSWAPVDVRCVGFDGVGRLWFGSPQGVGCRDDAWRLYTGAEGLPYNDFTALHAGTGGLVWFGTAIGAIRYDGTEWAYREGRRWLPDNAIRDVAVTADGTAWFATGKGVGAIEQRPMTLKQKAARFQEAICTRHERTPYRYVQSVRVDRPGDASTWHNRDDDNDGQYTGMYGAAQCFAYAATKDPAAKERATAAFEALRFLVEVTQGGTPPAPPGFVARTILPTDGPDPNATPAYSEEHDRERQATSDRLWKVIHPRWPRSADGKWYWKCDTSSDELDGHYFLYARYYDLVAETDEEKERVRDVVRKVTDHLLAHDLRLVDWDGRPTRWANFSPGSLNHDPNWWPERGLNSLSILGHLRVAAHVTGDEKYAAAADELARKHAYAMNGMYPKNQRGPGSYVQFDDEMAFMNYYNLLLYETDPQLRSMYALSCFQYWELEACERNSFLNFAYAACCAGESVPTPWGDVDVSPGQQCLEDAVDTLKRYPVDRFNWRHTNSHRTDIVPLPEYVRDPGDAAGCGHRVDGTPVPIDERSFHVWADDPWRLDTGREGEMLEDGSAYLLAYYMGLYHGFIDEE
ncbi:MAG: hypothetical protein JXR94_14495 [Candidatus Hydrogenedentes bacterium]|nr:hypothetical protein [Candidatus Hydrogenedentota bacterium]